MAFFARFSKALSQQNAEEFMECINRQINRQNSQGKTMLCEGTTPFHVALIKGDTLMAKILLNSLPTTRASTMLQNGRLDFDQLLLYHAEFPDDTEAMNFLLDLGANINAVNSNHETSLMVATRCGDLKAMKMLLSRENIDLYTKDRYGSTALHIAVKENRSKTVDLLLSCQQFDVNCQDSRGNTAFWLSMHLGHDDISERFLKDSRVDVNVKGCLVSSRWQTTALYIASFRNNLRMVSCILASRRLEWIPTSSATEDRALLELPRIKDLMNWSHFCLKQMVFKSMQLTKAKMIPFGLRFRLVQFRSLNFS
ncbi:hypothetical protein N7523_010072 [Penicillium sp. IBT 18751x]|nr:hypothetical protein N7523_010072 [Penicillium sp. IBT 18751x]